MPASKQLVILVKKASVFQYLDWAGRLVTNRCGAQLIQSKESWGTFGELIVSFHTGKGMDPTMRQPVGFIQLPVFTRVHL